VRSANDKPYYVISNVRSGETVFVNALAPHDPEKEWKTQDGGALQFECNDGQCGLKELWAGAGHPAYYVPGPRGRDHESTRLALIRSANSK